MSQSTLSLMLAALSLVSAQVGNINRYNTNSNSNTFATASNNRPLTPIPITVYYETLCPYSVNFILNKLVPIYNDKNFTSLLSRLTLVPYGHVRVINGPGYEYSCQHGPAECDRNKLHGCAVKYIGDTGTLLNYIACLFSLSTINYINKDNKQESDQCKHKVPDHLLQKITNCNDTNEGWDIFNQHGFATDMFFGGKQFYVPFVSFNNVLNETFSEAAKNDLRKTLCIENGAVNGACSMYTNHNC